MHVLASPQSAFPRKPLSLGAKSEGAFSLVEVTLAIGIIAFAFVALFGLLPTGMTTFRSAIDQTNESVIVQDMNSMVQVTPWSKIESLPEDKGGDVFYFDEEARRTDTYLHQSTDRQVIDRRLYQVKLLVDPFDEPSGNGQDTSDMPDARRINVVIGDYLKKQSQDEFKEIKKADDLKGKSNVRSRPLIVTKMESSLGS